VELVVEKRLSVDVKLSAQGRLVIPAVLRKAMDLHEGDRLIARKEGNSLVLERREAIMQRLWDQFSQIPQNIRLAEELIAERRAEAQIEDME
jgi:AbrB family looped-hinge helix DNA binding protein